MSLIDVARDALKEIPMADILRERLSLALDQSSAFERQVAELQAKTGRLEAQLERERLDHQQTQRDLQSLRDLWAEEIRIFNSIEFRRGKRTAGRWVAFCPKCHIPALEYSNKTGVSCPGCDWQGVNLPNGLTFTLRQLEDACAEA